METRLRMVSPLERALYLRTVEPLQDLPSPALALIAQHTRERFFRKGAVIYRMGERVGQLHIVVEGRIRLDGGGYGQHVVGPGESLGYLSMLARDSRGLAAEAEVDTTTLVIDAEDFYDLLEDHFTLFNHVVTQLAEFMLRQRERIEDGTYLAPGEGLLECPERELDLVERLLFLRQGAVLNQASMDSLIEIARAMTEVRLPADEVLWRPGDPSGFLYILVDGSVTCEVKETGHTFRCGPGYPLGNLESLAGRPRWYRARTERPIVALQGQSNQFLDLLEDHFEMARGFLSTMAAGILRVVEDRHRRARSAEDGASPAPGDGSPPRPVV